MVEYRFPSEEELFQRRMIALRSANEIGKWWFALWFATILALGIVAAVAFTPGLNGLSRVEQQFQADARR
jgi:UDP-N-acetylmuramyl pentapeptide phosphotransferase/UDP-N-acetylglucosamine-1-phosphate transferase